MIKLYMDFYRMELSIFQNMSEKPSAHKEEKLPH